MFDEDLFGDQSECDREGVPHAARLYEIIHDAIRPYLAENKVAAGDIMAALGMISGEVAEMYVDDEFDDVDFDDFDGLEESDEDEDFLSGY